jgi:integrase
MANATDNLRDRAFILFLYESGARIGEIMSIQLKHFEPDKYGAKVLIPKGKTGPRKIRIIASAPAISNWLSNHPDRKNKLSLLFCGISNYKRGEDIVYQNYRKMLRKMAKRAGIDKPVNPHHFMGSREP